MRCPTSSRPTTRTAAIAVILSQGRRTLCRAGALLHRAEPRRRDRRATSTTTGGPTSPSRRCSEDGVCQGGPQSGAELRARAGRCEPGGICARPGNASVLLQQANGTFGPARNTDVEETPIGIAAIDANCDGRDDLVVANLASSTVSVLRSNGDGIVRHRADAAASAGRPESDRRGGGGLRPRRRRRLCRREHRGAARSAQPAPAAWATAVVRSSTFRAWRPGSRRRAAERGRGARLHRRPDSSTSRSPARRRTKSACCVGVGDGTLLVGRVLRRREPHAERDRGGRTSTPTAATTRRRPTTTATSNNLSMLSNCVRDVGCDPFPPVPPATPARGDARRCAATATATAGGRRRIWSRWRRR